MSTEFYWIAVALVVITSASRLTRLATYDDFPPVVWVRDHLDRLLPGKWALVLYCGYCASFWMTSLVIGTAWAAGVFDGQHNHWTLAWWLLCGALGGSYLAAILMANDGDNGEEG